METTCFARLRVPNRRDILISMSMSVRYPRLATVSLRIGLLMDRRGQDLIEYALVAGFVAVSAGAIMPGVSNSISKVFGHVSSVLAVAASQS